MDGRTRPGALLAVAVVRATTSDLAETAARPDSDRHEVELRVEASDDRSDDDWPFGRTG